MERDIEKAFRRVGLDPKFINGKPAVTIGDFVITFYNYYFVVEGKVPLSVANELYAIEPIGRTDIRSGGDCGLRPPATWARARKDGKAAISKTETDKLREQAKKSPIVGDILKDTKYYFCATDEEFAALPAYVDTYHIDSELGLYIFLETLRKHKLI